ncbi:NADPH:quinone reductase [Streptantibioticus cattleyicolor]|uniref:NADPH:quinone reductase n=1 Tax=Streptantibioticus cattleyicolor TaxID=29303 RepID=UPI0002DA919C|nr:NADPH:quinone reductase [Streptantibioticus cattleyicolor]
MSDAVVGQLRDGGCEVFAHDLYAEGFPPLPEAGGTATVGPAAAAADPLVARRRAEVATLDALVFVPHGRAPPRLGCGRGPALVPRAGPSPATRCTACGPRASCRTVTDVRQVVVRTVIDVDEATHAVWLRRARAEAIALPA